MKDGFPLILCATPLRPPSIERCRRELRAAQRLMRDQDRLLMSWTGGLSFRRRIGPRSACRWGVSIRCRFGASGVIRRDTDTRELA